MSEPLFKPIRKFVRAGAGAGKTYNLTRQVVGVALDFKSQTGRWPRTVLTTFTRKATQELKERMTIYCLTEKPEALEFVQSSTYLKITTMHGLLNAFLSRYSYALQIPHQIQIIDSTQGDFWRKQILRQFVDRQAIPKELEVFSFKRLLSYLKDYEQVYWGEEVKRLGDESHFEALIQDLLKPLGQDLERVLKLGSQGALGDKWEPFLQKLSELLENLKTPKPWEEKREALASGLENLGSPPRKSKHQPGLEPETLKLLKEALKNLKKMGFEPEYSPTHWPFILATLKAFEGFAEKFMESLDRRKRQEGSLEANDLEFYSAHLMRTKPELFQSFSKEMEAWFIDEFQDTSPLQLKILDSMIRDQSCYMVGDPQQSIYLFRGSRSEVFLNQERKMKEQGAQMEHLKKNYRSKPQLVSFFNTFFGDLSPSFQSMEAHEESHGETPGEAGEETNQKTHKQAPPEVCVQISPIQDDEKGEAMEMDHIGQQLGTLLDQGVSPKNICLLSRTHRQGDLLQKKLIGLGFPVLSHSSSQFYSRRETLDALALLKFLLNPWDDENLVLLLRSPWIGLKDEEIFALLKGVKNNYWKPLEEFFHATGHGAGLSLIKALKEVSSQGVAWTFRRSLMDLGFFAYTHGIDSSGRREANLWKLVNMVEKSARQPGSSLLQLIYGGGLTHNLDHLGDRGDASSSVEPNKIQLMTIHASKGLEFEYVFLPFLHKKPMETRYTLFTYFPEKNGWSLRMPLGKENKLRGGPLESLWVQQMKQRERAEALQVLYVAMTRAKKRLYLSWTGKVQTNSWASFLEKSVDKLKTQGLC